MAPSDNVGQLAVRVPGAPRLLWRHGLDYARGGNWTLDQLCAEVGADAKQVAGELSSALRRPPPADWVRWDERPIGDLVQHLVEQHHRPFVAQREQLNALLDSALAGGSWAGGVALAAMLRATLAEIAEHQAKEETQVFPLLRRGQPRAAGGAIAIAHREHREMLVALALLRQQTNDFRGPDEADASWVALWPALAAMDADLREHVHLENNVLFPRALAA